MPVVDFMRNGVKIFRELDCRLDKSVSFQLGRFRVIDFEFPINKRKNNNEAADGKNKLGSFVVLRFM